MKDALKTYFDFTTFTKYDPQQAGEENGWHTQKISRKRDNLELLRSYQSKSETAQPGGPGPEQKDQNQSMFFRTKSTLLVEKKKVIISFSYYYDFPSYFPSFFLSF